MTKNTVTVYGRISQKPLKYPAPTQPLEFSFTTQSRHPVAQTGGISLAPDVWPYSFEIEVPEGATLQKFGNDRKLIFEGKEHSASLVYSLAHHGYDDFSIVSESHNET